MEERRVRHPGDSLRIGRRVMTSVLVSVLWAALPFAVPTAAKDCPEADSTISEAERLFNENQSGEAREVLSGLTETCDLSDPTAHRAFVLLGRVNYSLDDTDGARKAWGKAFCADRSWNPSASEFSPEAMEQINLARFTLDCDEKKGGGKPWLWIGLAAAGATTAIVLLVSGDDEEPLPDFPDPPAVIRFRFP